MICPNCNRRLKVVETRNDGNITYRRYACVCGVHFYTKEEEHNETKNKLTKLRYKIRVDSHKE